MTRTMLRILAAMLLCLVALATASTWTRMQAAPDSPAASFTLPWWTVDGGGGTSQGGSYVLQGTAGQPEAASSSGGTYVLNGGFWSGQFFYSTYIPLVMR